VVLSVAPAVLRDLRALALRDEFGSATSSDTTRRSLRRTLLDCGGSGLDEPGERSPSGSIILLFDCVFDCNCFQAAQTAEKIKVLI